MAENLVQIDEHEYFAEPPLDVKEDYVMDPQVKGRIHHVCMRRPVQGKDGPAEVLTMGRVNWDMGRALFYCSYCSTELPFDVWELWEPTSTPLH